MIYQVYGLITPLAHRTDSDHLVFDIMGEVGFAQSFGMIDNGKDHNYVLFVEKAMHALS